MRVLAGHPHALVIDASRVLAWLIHRLVLVLPNPA